MQEIVCVADQISAKNIFNIYITNRAYLNTNFIAQCI